MKKLLFYLLSLATHAAILVLLSLLFYCMRGILEGVGFAEFPVWEVIGALLIAVLLYYAVRAAAALRRPYGSLVLLLFSLILLALGHYAIHHREDRWIYYDVSPSMQESDYKRVDLSPDVSITLRRYQYDQGSLLHLDVEQDGLIKREFLTISASHLVVTSKLDLGTHHILSIPDFDRNEKYEVTRLHLRYRSLLGERLQQVAYLAMGLSLLLMLASCRLPVRVGLTHRGGSAVLTLVRRCLSMRMWVIAAILSFCLAAAILIVSYSERGVAEEARLEYQGKSRSYDTAMVATSMIMLKAIEDSGSQVPHVSFGLNASSKETAMGEILACGERARATNAYLSYRDYSTDGEVAVVTCRYAHWPFLLGVLYASALGMSLLTCAHYRAEMVRRHMAEKGC